MFPTLIQFGPLAITSLGISLFLALIVGSFFAWQRGKEENFDPEPLMDGIIISSVIEFFGSRLLFVASHPSLGMKAYFNFMKYPGFSFYGALLAGLIFWIYFCHRHKWDFYKLADVLVFGIIPGQILVSLGTFFDGSGFGTKTTLPWGIIFPGLSYKVHPISLYQIIFLGFLLWLVYKLVRQYRFFNWYKGKRTEAAPGFLFLTYLLFFGIFRFALEFVSRESLYLLNLSIGNWLSLVIILGALILLYERTGRGLEFLPKRRESKTEMPKRRTEYLEKRSIHIKAGMDAKKTHAN
jgi:phosphatidylglycerol:prolipoprotein diacylglycerol transferase